MRIKGTLVVGVIAIVAAMGGAYYVSQREDCRDFTEATVRVDDTSFQVAIADTAQKQQLGLSGCARLPDKSGMYFAYSSPQRPAFWMRGMLVPLDIIWIVEGRVVGVEADVPPPASPKTELLPTYRPEGEVTAVLELAAGSAAKYGIQQGSIVTF